MATGTTPPEGCRQPGKSRVAGCPATVTGERTTPVASDQVDPEGRGKRRAGSQETRRTRRRRRGRGAKDARTS
jgi:hypothetical protein